MDFECAKKIIENGYDRYLELSTLYIIRTHDRNEFYRRVEELKFICLERHRILIRKRNIYEITGRLFVTETDELFKKILSSKNIVESNDPRLHIQRSVYRFEK